MLSFAELRSEAENLAGKLPAADTHAGFKTTVQTGASSRQRSGQGEDFWQYRGHTPEDSVGQIDWRRSATGDDLYIRQQELQSARLLSLWVDPSAGFNWTSDDTVGTKADCARILLTALAIRYAETGDLVDVIGGVDGPKRSHQLVGPLIDSFLTLETSSLPPANSASAHIILASDFYSSFEALSAWVNRAAEEGRTGILLQVTDPAERAFAYQGRVKFRIPGSPLERVIGRAETLKTAYQERFDQRQSDVKRLCQSVGWHFMPHQSEGRLAETAYAMLQILSAEHSA